MNFNEDTYVEQPFLQQLQELGWEIINGDTNDPSITFRNSFRQVILEPILSQSLQKINPFLEQDQIAEKVYEIKHLKSNNLFESNQEVFEFLTNGSTVEINRLTNEKSPNIKFIDFENIENNSFIAINQFKVNVIGTSKNIIPDIVLFVNGIPIGVVECKSPKVAEPMNEAINQLMRYSNNRNSAENEGNERLFYYNQLMIATTRQEARISTIKAPAEYYLEWKDPYPTPLSNLHIDNTAETVNSQQILIEGVLRKENILDIINNFIVYKEDDKGKKIKIVCRYQQYRAVCKAIQRLQDPTLDQKQKGGIIWHTQGSGKSLTMVFLIRKLRNTDFGKKFKVVFLTDRQDLQRQIGDTAQSIGEPIYPRQGVKNNIENIQAELKTDNSNIVNAMIQKFQEKDDDVDKEKLIKEIKTLPLLNESPNILLLIDEAHRSQYTMLGANLQNALPNSIKIGFTGTPIEKTNTTFGSYIDTYTIEQAVKDKATVPIVYVGKTSKDGIKDKEAMDQEFEDMFKEKTEEEKQAILKKYGIKGNYLEANEIIEEKAKNMVKFYLEKIFVNGFKAQIVAVSRLAAVRYKEKLDLAIQIEIQNLKNGTSNLENKDLIDLRLLEKLETSVIISGKQNDTDEFKPYTDGNKHKTDIANFKKPMKDKDMSKTSQLGIIVVKDMLLTGFDAPIEQVMFLDRKLVNHNLLQAIARVNRTYQGKNCGYLVDYYGVGNHLKEALDKFTQTDIQGAMVDFSQEIPKLEERYKKVIQIFKEKGVKDFNSNENIDLCIELLEDLELRAKFTVAYKYLAKSIDIISPDKAILPYMNDFKALGFILYSARNRYRDNQMNLLGSGDKVKSLIDKYLTSQGIDTSIPPVSILDSDFEDYINGKHSTKSKASEMEHSIRFHISNNYENDPEYYKRLSEKLEEIIKEYKENWEILIQELSGFLSEIKKGRNDGNDFGLDNEREMPIYDTIRNVIVGGKSPSIEDNKKLIELTIEIVELLHNELQVVDFWSNANDIGHKRLKRQLSDFIMKSRLIGIDRLEDKDRLIEKILNQAKRLDNKLKS